jgi:hypothetical protein
MRKLLVIGLICSLLLGFTWAAAAAPTELTLVWWTVDGGGGTLIGDGPSGPYTLVGTVGQPDVGIMSGGGFTLDGGFIGGGEVGGPEYRVYLPLVMRKQ